MLQVLDIVTVGISIAYSWPYQWKDRSETNDSRINYAILILVGASCREEGLEVFEKRSPRLSACTNSNLFDINMNCSFSRNVYISRKKIEDLVNEISSLIDWYILHIIEFLSSNVCEKFLWKWLIGVWTEIWFSFLDKLSFLVVTFINFESSKWFCWLDSNEQTSSNFFLLLEYFCSLFYIAI